MEVKDMSLLQIIAQLKRSIPSFYKKIAATFEAQKKIGEMLYVLKTDKAWREVEAFKHIVAWSDFTETAFNLKVQAADNWIRYYLQQTRLEQLGLTKRVQPNGTLHECSRIESDDELKEVWEDLTSGYTDTVVWPQEFREKAHLNGKKLNEKDDGTTRVDLSDAQINAFVKFINAGLPGRFEYRSSHKKIYNLGNPDQVFTVNGFFTEFLNDTICDMF